MRLLLILCFALAGSLCAQTATEVEIEISRGDTLLIGKAKGGVFQHLDMYRKTRWAGNEPAYDTATGNGFFQSFFATGDFDVAELPKQYAGRKFVVLGVEILSNKKTGQPMNIMYLQGEKPNMIIWVDFDKAFESGELKLLQD
ncbi:MAG: hypothetical protein EBV15_08895 [Bacteroidetes bacterium]|jgi:hypothetical protein|nr:hypothetical protein [Bacteroidota bacterium]